MSPPAAGRGAARRPRPAPGALEPTRPAASGPDLAARLRASQRTVRARLIRREALADVIRATTATLEPSVLAHFLVDWAPHWLPLNGWAVVSSDLEGQLTVLELVKSVCDELRIPVPSTRNQPATVKTYVDALNEFYAVVGVALSAQENHAIEYVRVQASARCDAEPYTVDGAPCTQPLTMHYLADDVPKGAAERCAPFSGWSAATSRRSAWAGSAPS